MFPTRFESGVFYERQIPKTILIPAIMESKTIEPTWTPFRINWTYAGNSLEFSSCKTEYKTIPIWAM